MSVGEGHAGGQPQDATHNICGDNHLNIDCPNEEDTHETHSIRECPSTGIATTAHVVVVRIQVNNSCRLMAEQHTLSAEEQIAFAKQTLDKHCCSTSHHQLKALETTQLNPILL